MQSFIVDEYKKYGLGRYGTSANGHRRASLAGVHSHSKRDEEDRIKEIILSLLFFKKLCNIFYNIIDK